MISAIVIAKNEERNIGDCVDALLQLTDDVIILDSGSTDKTIEIALGKGAQVQSIQWLGFGPTKNLSNQYAKHPWILSIDADEVLTSDLISEIKSLILDPKNIYAINILTNYCGSWIKHSGWYPSYKKRLYHQDYVSWDDRKVHENLQWNDPSIQVIRLKNELQHFSYRTAEDHVRKGDYYAKLGAEQLIKQGKQVHWIKKKIGPSYRFFRMYILKLGMLDGKAGFLLAIREARMVALRYKYYKEMQP